MKWYELKILDGPLLMNTMRFRTEQEAIDAYSGLRQNTDWASFYTFTLLEVDTDSGDFFDTLECIAEIYPQEY